MVSSPKFTAGEKAERDQIITEAKKKHDVCKRCLGFTFSNGQSHSNSTKAFHSEVVEDYSGARLISALRQAFAVRNMPSQITTDPGRNFVKAKSLFTLD